MSFTCVAQVHICVQLKVVFFVRSFSLVSSALKEHSPSESNSAHYSLTYTKPY